MAKETVNVIETDGRGGREMMKTEGREWSGCDRQRKRWEDNIREWTGLEFGRPKRAVENRENGENWLRNQLWCPNDPCD